jgi:TPR repeat protein
MPRRGLSITAIVILFALLGCQQPPAGAPVAKGEPVTLGPEEKAIQEFAQYKQQADRGDAGSQYMVGYRYEKGIGVQENYAQAAQWYQRAANQGFAAAQWSLGELYEKNLVS